MDPIVKEFGKEGEEIIEEAITQTPDGDELAEIDINDGDAQDILGITLNICTFIEERWFLITTFLLVFSHLVDYIEINDYSCFFTYKQTIAISIELKKGFYRNPYFLIRYILRPHRIRKVYLCANSPDKSPFNLRISRGIFF